MTTDSPAKVVVVGDLGVGKTSLLHRIAYDSFAQKVSTTIGVDFMHHCVTLDDGRSVQLQLWDTAGQERFVPLQKQYWRRADAIIAVFDASSTQSLASAECYLQMTYDDFGGNALPPRQHPVRALVATKCDAPQSERTEDEQMRVSNSGEYGHVDAYARVSAKTGEGVVDIVNRLATCLSYRALDAELQSRARAEESSLVTLQRRITESESCTSC